MFGFFLIHLFPRVSTQGLIDMRIQNHVPDVKLVIICWRKRITELLVA